MAEKKLKSMTFTLERAGEKMLFYSEAHFEPSLISTMEFFLQK